MNGIVFDIFVLLDEHKISFNLGIDTKVESVVVLNYNELPKPLMEAIIKRFDGELNTQEQLLLAIKRLSRVPKENVGITL